MTRMFQSEIMYTNKIWAKDQYTSNFTSPIIIGVMAQLVELSTQFKHVI